METMVAEPVVRSGKAMYRAWSMYDWANSAYNLVITSTIFPAYYEGITTQRDANGSIVSENVRFFGMTFKNSSLGFYSIAIAYLVIALLSPILSSIADNKGNKKRFMQFFCYAGSISCCALYFFTDKTLELGIICSALAAVGYCGSIVFYNSYLPEIAPEKDHDKVSAQGFAYGYIGSVILQIICLVFVLAPATFGLKDGAAASRLSFFLVGIWWAGFAQVTFFKLPKGRPSGKPQHKGLIAGGFAELASVWRHIRQLTVLKTFLIAFLFYSMGVQTVMLAATHFGKKDLNLNDSQLITTILVIQIVAIAGAFLMSKLSARLGNLRVLLLVVFIWIGACIAAYFTTNAAEFYILAGVVGMIMGGIQSLSRSTYSKLMPPTRSTASFFSFYDVTEKVAIVIGMFTFGFIDSVMNMRSAIIALITFFVLGALVLYKAIKTRPLAGSSPGWAAD